MHRLYFAALLCLAPYAGNAAAVKPAAALEPIRHIIVISLENHSFDNIFGFFPGAEGISDADGTAVQRDREGKAFKTLPPVFNTNTYPASIDKRFPSDLPNRPFPIEEYVAADEKTGDLPHSFIAQIDQIHEGKMDRFAAVANNGLVMGYYDGSKLGLWKYAQRYTLNDHFFHAAFGGSFLNHMWLICACTPRFPHAPDEMIIRFDAAGDMIQSGTVTEDGYAVNTVFPYYKPHPKAMAGSRKLLPPQDMPTIGDRLSEKGISWAWYAGGWNDAMAGKPHPLFQFHHQPFVYFRNFADGGEARGKHLKDEADFLTALRDNTLPAVSFYKPLGEFNLHPGYADMTSGDAHIVKILQAIEASPAWESSVVIVTFDENGGYWDHVPPPKSDRWGPGTRIPNLVISPFAKKGFVDSTVYDSTSILKFIETRFGLEPLGERDAAANDLTNALELP
jgi:phospholipase C